MWRLGSMLRLCWPILWRTCGGYVPHRGAMLATFSVFTLQNPTMLQVMHPHPPSITRITWSPLLHLGPMLKLAWPLHLPSHILLEKAPCSGLQVAWLHSFHDDLLFFQLAAVACGFHVSSATGSDEPRLSS